MAKDYLFPTGEDWNWRGATPFAHCVGIGDQVFISGQQPLDSEGNVLGAGDNGAQTRTVFENMKIRLEKM